LLTTQQLGLFYLPALSVSISEFLNKPANRYVTPLVKQATPDEYDKWVPVIMGWYVIGHDTECHV
jgi:hypothetical protein